jgi:hypothetical protein
MAEETQRPTKRSMAQILSDMAAKRDAEKLAKENDASIDSSDESGPVSFREKYSQEGIDLMKQAASGLRPYTYPEGGVVDVPDEMPLYSADGIKVKFPKAFQDAVEFIGDAAATAAGAGTAGFGYLVGGVADIMVKAGVSPSTANRFARDFVSMPDAFIGSPGSLVRGRIGPDTKITSKDGIGTAKPRQLNPNELPQFPESGPMIPRADAPPIDAISAEIGELVRRAASGNKKAIAELAEAAKVNPEAAAAAARLNIDLPPDVLSDNPQIVEAAGLTRSMAGTETSAAWRETLRQASEAADTAIDELGGSRDLAGISETVRSSLVSTQQGLRNGAKKLYEEVDAQIPKPTIVQPRTSVKLIGDIISEVGGVDNLSAKESLLLKKLTNPDAPMTYGALLRLKQDIGQAIGRMPAGPYSDVNQGALKRLYAALSEDQLSVAQEVGGDALRSQLRLANQTTAKQKAFEDRILKAFGEDLDGSIAARLRSAITSGSRGDISVLNRILKTIPKDLHREAIATALNAISQSGRSSDIGFGFNEFAKVYKGLKQNKPVYNLVIKTLGPENKQLLDDLFEISNRITNARANVIVTGKANQALVEGMTAEKIVGKFLQTNTGRRAIQAVSTGAGGMVGGVPGAMGGAAISDLLSPKGKDRVADAGKLFSSKQFKDVVDEAARTGQVAPETAAKLERSPAYKRWAKSVGIGDPRNWLMGALAVAGTDEGSVGPMPVEEVVETETTDSPALQSLIESMDPNVSTRVQEVAQ